MRDAQAVASAVYWTRAASPDAALACEACDRAARPRAPSPPPPPPAAARGHRLSGEMIGVATEALEVSAAGGVALPAELASAASAPAFAASLVDFYGRVAATENGVACRIEPAAVPAAGDPSAGTAAAEDAAVADALELGGALGFLGRGSSCSTGSSPGKLGSTYEARIACADRAPASSAASDVVSQNAARTARNASDAEGVAAGRGAGQRSVHGWQGQRWRWRVCRQPDRCARRVMSCVECKDRTFNFDGVWRASRAPGRCRGGDELLAIFRLVAQCRADCAQRVSTPPTKARASPSNATGDAACAEG